MSYLGSSRNHMSWKVDHHLINPSAVIRVNLLMPLLEALPCNYSTQRHGKSGSQLFSVSSQAEWSSSVQAMPGSLSFLLAHCLHLHLSLGSPGVTQKQHGVSEALGCDPVILCLVLLCGGGGQLYVAQEKTQFPGKMVEGCAEHVDSNTAKALIPQTSEEASATGSKRLKHITGLKSENIKFNHFLKFSTI